jgi:prefoldin subunit 5
MRIKSLVCVFLTLLFLFGQIYRSSASSTNNFSFHSAGVTIDLAFPKEAHPLENISHNLTITANTDIVLQNIALFIYAPVNSTWQHIRNQTITWGLLRKNQTLPTSEIMFKLPQSANGTLSCILYVQTNQTADYSSYTFYTTHVRTLTYSELLIKYDELLTKYNDTVEEYGTLLESYNELTAKYDTLNSTYNSLLNEYNALQTNYNSLNSTYHSLQGNYDSLQTSYYSLKANFDSLNQTCTDLENEINNLRQKTDASKIEIINTRNLTYLFIGTTIALIILIIYLKKKEPEPYVVIRKETVAVKPNENS